MGQLSASLTSFSRTIDDYSQLSKKEIIPAKQEKAFERVKNFRAELAEYRQSFERLKKDRDDAVRLLHIPRPPQVYPRWMRPTCLSTYAMLTVGKRIAIKQQPRRTPRPPPLQRDRHPRRQQHPGQPLRQHRQPPSPAQRMGAPRRPHESHRRRRGSKLRHHRPRLRAGIARAAGIEFPGPDERADRRVPGAGTGGYSV
ncbi:protein transport protein bos1 [Ascosphaera atra]|nr:protein transport protein bos1 [Ascosphaera atra]